MTNIPQLTYLFDPLCGWCYGASAAISEVASSGQFALSILPTGLFSGRGARPMDAHFSAFAWANDQQIASLTGMRFTEDYQGKVLGSGGMLDSSAATQALTAVTMTSPAQELDVLGRIQKARYIDGRDVTDYAVVKDILLEAGLDDAANQLEAHDAKMLAANSRRIATAQRLMADFSVQGVPALVIMDGVRRYLLPSQAIFGTPGLLARLMADRTV